jgi:predicted transposase YdaD
MGLNYPDEQIDHFIAGAADMILGIRGIEESSVYQSIFAKGRAAGKAEGFAEGLISIGQNSLGAPDEQVKAAIMGMKDLDRLRRPIARAANVSTWDELLVPEES